MKRLFKLTILAALIVAVSGCKVEDTIYIDMPLGNKSFSVGLDVIYDEGETTATGSVAVADTYTLTIDDTDLFDALKFYKNDEITDVVVENVTLQLILFSQKPGDEVHDLLIEAYIGEDKIDEYQNPLVNVFNQKISGDAALAAFMENIIWEAVSGKSVELRYTATYITTNAYEGERNPVNVEIGQDISAKITVRR